MNGVFDTIARSIIYVQFAREVWIPLKRRLCLRNGSRKYFLTKEVYSMIEDGISIYEYHTKLKCYGKGWTL